MQMSRLVSTLVLLSVFSATVQGGESDRFRPLVEKSLALLGTAAEGHAESRDCFSCHHQAMPVLALVAARKQGFKIDETLLAKQIDHTWKFLDKNRDAFAKGQGTGGQADTAGFAMLTLAHGKRKPDETTDAVVAYLLGKDREKGFWPSESNRPPTEASPFTTTFLGMHALKHFGNAKNQDERNQRLAKANDWVKSTAAKDTEDRVFRLRALSLTPGNEQEIKTVVAAIMKTQKADGGWSQTAEMESDAYATGLVLVAVHEVGNVSVNDAAWKRGLEYLLKQRQEDGSWLVKSRSKPFQKYFETGFPGGKDQWISCHATAWATMAMILACEK